MSSSRSNNGSDDFLGESWVEVGGSKEGTGTPSSITQQLTVEDYLRLLREAQESNQSSCRVSQCSSRRDSPRDSPKSPPNSPVTQETPGNFEWDYYVDKSRVEIAALEWSSRPNTSPPKPWSFGSPRSNDKFSLRYAKIGNTPLFSKRGLCIMFLTNLFSLLLGTGVGIFLNRHTPAIKVR